MGPAPITFEEEMKKNPSLKLEDIASFRNWYTLQRHLPPITDKDIVLFLNSCHYSIEQTKQTVDHYFTVRTHCPEIFENVDPCKVDVKKNELVVDMFMLPNTTPNGSRVMFVKFLHTDPADFNFGDACKSFVITADLEHNYCGTSKGFIILFDMEGIQFGHITKLHVLIMKKILFYLQDAMPVRLTGLHFLNTVSFMDTILAMMKPFLKKDLSDNMKMHTSDFSTVYKYVPQEMFPNDYPGGKNPSMKELRTINWKLRQENKKWFEDRESTCRVNEKLRPGKAKSAGDVWGVEGSFKKLELD